MHACTSSSVACANAARAARLAQLFMDQTTPGVDISLRLRNYVMDVSIVRLQRCRRDGAQHVPRLCCSSVLAVQAPTCGPQRWTVRVQSSRAEQFHAVSITPVAINVPPLHGRLSASLPKSVMLHAALPCCSLPVYRRRIHAHAPNDPTRPNSSGPGNEATAPCG